MSYDTESDSSTDSNTPATHGVPRADGTMFPSTVTSDAGVAVSQSAMSHTVVRSLPHYETIWTVHAHKIRYPLPTGHRLCTDGGLPTCESCGQPDTHTVTVGPGGTQRSCGCRVVADGGVPQDFESLASTCESCGGDVEPRYLEDGECPGCVYGEPVTDGGVVQETVGALDVTPSTDVHHASRTGGPRQKVHTDATCRHLKSANRTRTRPVEAVPDDWPVCRACLGISAAGEPTGDMQATSRALQDTAPEELGLSPLGQRSAANGGEQ